MRFATFGDLHLTHNPVLDKFRANEEVLLRFNDHLGRDHDRIILMGDIFQTDYGSAPGSRSDVLDAIMSRYPRVVECWQDARYEVVFGNHDLITQSIMGARNQIHITMDGLRMWFIHGHQFDPFIGNRGQMPFFVTWLVGGLRRIGLNRLADFLEGPFYLLGQKLFPHLDLAAWRALIQGQNDIIAMGHSHLVACRPIGQGIYLNSGDCATDCLRYLSIDTQTRVVEVRGFSPPNSQTIFHSRVLAF